MKTSREIYELTKSCPLTNENTSDWMEQKWFSEEELKEKYKEIFNDIEDMPEAWWVVVKSHILRCRDNWVKK